MREEKRPNLLYIHTDQHNPYVTGCYGDPLVQTPNLDRLAAGGVLFENTYCNSPICVPSRMSMLTGLHPYQNEVWTNSHGLDSSIPTMAHAMGAAGYQPVLFGRMHSVGPDQLHGYTDRYVGDHSGNYIGGRGPDRGILDGTAGPDRASLVKSGPGQSAYQIHDEYVTAATVDYLNRLGIKEKADGQLDPFSIAVGLMLPHPPYVARQADYDVYADAMTMPKKPQPYDQVTHPFLRAWRDYTSAIDVSEAEILRSRAAYWALVHRTDIMIGQILHALEANGFADNTMIVYTSDHGDMQGEHGLWWKHVFYEESVKVPLIVAWPGVIEGGQRSERVVSALDVNATMLDALGAPALPNSPGRSLLGLVSNARATPTWDDVAYSEYCADEYVPASIDNGKSYQRMIRQDEWKLIYYHGMEPQLFNLAEDPGETTDRSQDPACQSVRRELMGRLLSEWHPEVIAATMAEKRQDNALLRAWAKSTEPTDRYRWDLRPEMNYLDQPPAEQ